jgi:hypothetical protein
LYRLKPREQYLPFRDAEDRLTKARNYWICTARPDGRPHSIPVWGFWVDGDLCSGTGRSSREAQNLAQNAGVSIPLDSGDDVVILEGTAVEIDLSDKAKFEKLDAASRAKYKSPFMAAHEVVLYSVRPARRSCVDRKGFSQQRHPLGIRYRQRLNGHIGSRGRPYTFDSPAITSPVAALRRLPVH